MSSKRKKSSKGSYYSASSGQNGRRNASDYCSDRRLLPRIQQYLSECGGNVVDVDDMAISLQADYPEYGRRKRVPFRALVDKVYSSFSPDAAIEGPGDEEWLKRRERVHLLKRTSNRHNCEDDALSSDSESSMSDSEAADMEVAEGFNMMNNSILQLYGSTTVLTNQQPVTDHMTLSTDHMTSHMHDTSISDLTTENIAMSSETVVAPEHSIDPNDSKLHSSNEQESKRDARMKRVRRSPDEVGDGNRPKRKRAKAKGERSSKASPPPPIERKSKQEFAVSASSVSFSDVGGCESALEDVCRLLLHLRHPELFSQLGVRPPQGFLLHGPPGCGKTLLAHAIAGELALPFIKLAATEVVSGVSGETEGTIRDLFTLAKEHAPCVLFVDEVDAICPKRETAHREMERRVVTQLLACLDDLNQTETGRQVLVIGATSRVDSLDPALRRSGRFDREVCLGIPSVKERESILRLHCAPLRLEDSLDYSLISQACPGFVGADLVALVREASLCAINRVLARENELCETPPTRIPGPALMGIIKNTTTLPTAILESTYIAQDDFTEALKSVQPSAKREGFATVPDTTWADVGALEDVREELTMAILAPVRYPAQFAQLGLTSPPGVLLAGPPGCGKTLLAKAIANETGINFISVKGPELLNMYVGESERGVRQVFQRARNSAPCVIFFDELDALCPRRSDSADTNASARVVNQLLTEMDGLESRKQVFVMGATNRPDIIDPAVLRPGRLDKVVYVGLPSARDRQAILSTITKGGSRPKLAADVDLSQLASDAYCRGFSGADLNALVREAAIVALKEYMSTQGQSVPPNMMEVSVRHFNTALSKFRPSVSAKDCAFYEQMETRFTANERTSTHELSTLP